MTTTPIIELDERRADRSTASLPVGRVPLPERVAMRVGLALILWSRDRAARQVPAAVQPHGDVDDFRLASMRGLPIH